MIEATAILSKHLADRMLVAMAGLTPTPENGYTGLAGGMDLLACNVEEVSDLVFKERARMDELRAGMEADREIFHKTFCLKAEEDLLNSEVRHCVVCRMFQIHIDLIDGKGRPGNE